MKNTQNLYLKVMYLLKLEHDKIRVTDIADKLNFTKSSVSKALVRLNNNGLIKYETYGDVILSEEAINIAKDIISKEDILELFFIGVLNISSDQARKDIDIISEHVSNETNSKLKNYIKKSLHIDDMRCKCIGDNCNNCETKTIKNRVESNSKWLNILKEKK